MLNYNLQSQELRIFLVIVSFGLVTAAIGSLSFVLKVYHVFIAPLITGVLTIFILNQEYLLAVTAIVFTLYMSIVAKHTNKRFILGQTLIQENSKLIGEMDVEIKNKELAQKELETYQQELETVIESRTQELVETNVSLKKQIDKREETERELENLAYYDVLTELPNRSLLIERLKRAVSVANRNESLLSVLFIDLDRFKAINDSLGHALGDKLLMQVAMRLKKLLRESDTVARNGGDEFVVVIENLNDVREAFVVAEKIINAMHDIFEIDSHEIHIGASVGISIYPIDGHDALELLKMADTAMYCAKGSGTNRFEFYSSHMSSQIQDRLEMENALRTAIKNDEFFVVYQPQVDINSNKTVGLEALLRWKNTERGLVSPAIFIPVLEETGLIYEVGEWVIKNVFDFIKSGQAHGAKVSINLSALQCSSHNFSETISNYLQQSGINASQVEFEITESLLINDFNKTEKFLNAIHDLGCTIALDDFGTGYTSFGYLTKLPLDIIKLDQSLVANIDQQQNLQDIVRAIVTMCQSLKLENVFEGVETKTELAQIESLGGHVIQGYLYSKPLDVDQLQDWFSEHAATAQNNGSF